MTTGDIIDDNIQLTESVDRFVRERCGPNVQSALRTGECEAQVQIARHFVDLGWLAILIAEADGGLGGNLSQASLVATGVGKGLIPWPYVETAVVAAVLLSGFETARPLLLGLADGSSKIAVATSEPGHPFGSKPQSHIRTSSDGRMLLSGRKNYVPWAQHADHLVVSASRSSNGEFVLAVVRSDAPGVKQSMHRLLDGRIVADIAFEDVVLPQDRLLARGDAARAAFAMAMDAGCVAAGAEAVGAMEGALDATRAHLETRKQFGAQIGSFQALRHRFADMVTEFRLARSAVSDLATRLTSLHDAEVRRRAVSLMKARVDKAARFVGEQAIQLHGGIGMTDDYVIGHYYKRLLVLETMFGTRSAHVRRIASSYVNPKHTAS